MKRFWNGFWLGVIISTIITANTFSHNNKWFSSKTISNTIGIFSDNIKYHYNLTKNTIQSLTSGNSYPNKYTNISKKYKGVSSTKTQHTSMIDIKNIVNSQSNDFRKKVANEALKYIGTPYVYGGTTPRGFDCSGFVQYVYKQFDIKIPRTVHEIANRFNRTNNPQTGDFVIINGYKHMGIYLGNGRFIHASSTKGVTVDNANSYYYKNRITCYLKVY